MKKAFILSASIVLFIACNSSDNNKSADTNDTIGLTNPIAIDTVKHPSGMANQNVISTDTAAMNVQNSINKAKEADKKQ